MEINVIYMLKILGIESSKCIGCENCIYSCPAQLFSLQNNNPSGEKESTPEVRSEVYFADPDRVCIQCGHCLAVCPADAVKYQSPSPPVIIPSEFSKIKPSFENFHLFSRSKRSIRNFSSKTVPDQLIEKILETMRYAPSASNARSWKFLVITDQAKIQKISDQVIHTMEITQKILQNPVLKKLLLLTPLRKSLRNQRISKSINRIIQRSKAGFDPIFFQAPCLIIVYSPKYGNLNGCDSGIITTYGMFAAETLGLGSCWIGIAQEAMMRVKKIRKICGIPKGFLPWSVFVVGYPKIKYSRLPPRDELNVSRIKPESRQ